MIQFNWELNLSHSIQSMNIAAPDDPIVSSAPEAYADLVSTLNLYFA
jgi:hypothetical protein